jgi:hypothetical protein
MQSAADERALIFMGRSSVSCLPLRRSQLDDRSLKITVTFSRSVHSVSIGAWLAST